MKKLSVITAALAGMLATGAALAIGGNALSAACEEGISKAFQGGSQTFSIDLNSYWPGSSAYTLKQWNNAAVGAVGGSASYSQPGGSITIQFQKVSNTQANCEIVGGGNVPSTSLNGTTFNFDASNTPAE